MKVAFAGTPAFASAALSALHAAGHDIPLVLTQPDRPAGRGMKLQASPVKEAALALGLPVVQPRSLRLDGRFPDDAAAARQALMAADADVMVVAAYGLLLPPWVLAMPRLGCINIHASLLPRWRGAAPIHRAIEAGDAETGITIMQMDAGLDTGDMLLTVREPIGSADTTATLHDRLAACGAAAVVQALAQLSSLPRRPQPAEGVTYAHKIEKAEAAIDWQAPAEVLARRLRAFDPFPGAHFRHGDSVVKAWAGQAEGADDVVAGPSHAPGTVVAADAQGLAVACGAGVLRITALQRPGGKRLPVREFLASHPIGIGERLG